MAIATSKAIKQIIVREYKKANPAFAILDTLQKALKQALALENQLSVDDVAPGRDLPATTRAQIMDRTNDPHRIFVTTGTDTFATNGIITTDTTGINVTDNEMMTATEYDRQHGQEEGGRIHRGERNRQAESLRDQVLSALDQAVTRRTNGEGVPIDKLSSVVLAIPHLEIIYPDPEERHRVMQALRFELKARLGDALLAADPVQPTGTHLLENPRQLLADPNSADDGEPTITLAPDNGVEEHHGHAP